jgi:hypothetical protein
LELRYVVRLEIEAVMSPIDSHVVDDEDRDHLMEISEILEHAEDAESSAIGPGVYERRRFDLCSECHRQFTRAPLGKKSAKSLDFSNN